MEQTTTNRLHKRLVETPDDWIRAWTNQKTKHQLLAYAKKIYLFPKFRSIKWLTNSSEKAFQLRFCCFLLLICGMNSIKMDCALIKRTSASKNMKLKLRRIEHLTREQVKVVANYQFSKYYEHARME